MWSKKGERRAHFAETTIDNVGAMLAEPSTISPASPGSPEGCRTCVLTRCGWGGGSTGGVGLGTGGDCP